jgi:hypothetical protein
MNFNLSEAKAFILNDSSLIFGSLTDTENLMDEIYYDQKV